VANTWRRFASEEVGGAKVRASYRDAVVESITNGEGHFQIRLEPRELASHALWHEVGLELPEHGTSAVAQVMLPSDLAQFGVISDIDDTVLVTNATSLLGMARSVIRSAAARLPFEGVAGLYTTLHAGVNPIFYVSSSPWNLYELLDEFMDINGIPHGPMLLQDWGIEENTFILASHETHKLAQIDLILDYYPDLPFILIGDSGQHDPEIYLRVIQSRPNRIRAAFIRDVTPDLRDQGVARIIEQSNAGGVEMLYVRDSSEALAHARRMRIV
jgi:phosphatidate phosphatase APP1